MNIDTIGWDIGGAHIKAVATSGNGRIAAVAQHPCPLWRGLDRLDLALAELARTLPIQAATTHAVTMTGELADLFPDRCTGVRSLIDKFADFCGAAHLLVFAGPHGLLPAKQLNDQQLEAIASANWYAGGLWAARRLGSGLLIDVGSTTTDLIPFVDGEVAARGYTDCERMRYDELVYSGIVRTPLMAIARRIPFEGVWLSLMNEHFATTADVYRLCGDLPEAADQHPTADGAPKDRSFSARRLARMIGRDAGSAPLSAWTRLAYSFRERQTARIASAGELQYSRPELTGNPPIIGAGVGRFLARAVASRLRLDYLDVDQLSPAIDGSSTFSVADCLPAAAVAELARQ
ncbi:MAG: hydantoinase/oxoprolinase family protein [Methylotetracoccus sp.]